MRKSMLLIIVYPESSFFCFFQPNVKLSHISENVRIVENNDLMHYKLSVI